MNDDELPVELKKKLEEVRRVAPGARVIVTPVGDDDVDVGFAWDRSLSAEERVKVDEVFASSYDVTTSTTSRNVSTLLDAHRLELLQQGIRTELVDSPGGPSGVCRLCGAPPLHAVAIFTPAEPAFGISYFATILFCQACRDDEDSDDKAARLILTWLARGPALS